MILNSIRKALLNISVPASRLIAKASKPECLFSSEQFLDAIAKLEDGDVLCSYVGWELSNYFIPGTFKHSAIHFKGSIYESTTKGTRKITIEEFLFKKDKIGIVRRSTGLSPEQLKAGLKFLEDNDQKEPYDFSFSIEGSSSWYCSKFVRAFFIAGEPEFEHNFELRKVFGEPTVQPDDFWLAKRFFTRIASYNVR